ncbi:PREDICTED: TNF receptor-associated factor 6-like [Acropora digitifera]|uniref:TNF receptor-associated factor 6-like n=1 Tax=Acropora digitifera TaxID=70779 RepID=UPI00077A14F5|nr:PREDICTED: TNF receptor-associated factor 6-like [Acropora digitifera]XP_015764764.1 PREDICTED: TNF receptor-associated factor 6-like [Acropora digitifera]XP_015764765.1 PREDICTED: TNF receptor-associated factor 6-like [Acropora digitifera]
MPGYQLANCDKSKVDKKYFCSFCELPVREAMQTTCGHFYCFSCLGNLRDPVLPLVLVCLVDKQQLQEDEVFADNFVRREVASIVVSCIFSSEGCPWKGEVRHLEAHTDGCEFQKVNCVYPECGKMVTRISLPDHLENECEFRLVACELCQSQVIFCKLQMHVSHEHRIFYKALMSDLEEKQMEAERRLDDVKMELGMTLDAVDALRRKVDSMERRMGLQNITGADLRE